MKKRNVVTIFLIFFLLIGIAGCKKKEVEDNENEKNNQTMNETNDDENEDVSEKEKTYDHVYPLTGIETNDDIDHRVIGVMINNHPAARPQSGLSKADIVFEILAEGSTTRFLALFHSELPDVVGPVRSAREYYFELAKDYNAVYVYHGAADHINDMIITRGIEHLNGSQHDNDQKLFKRESFRKAPHNSYLLMDNVYDFASQKGYDITDRIEPFEFLDEDEKLPEDKTGTYAKIGYIADQPHHTVEYKYNEQNGSYNRISDGEQAKELSDESPVQAHNVFIIETSHQVIDEEGRRAIDLKSNGQGILLQNGHRQDVTWKNRDGVIVPVKEGEIIPFIPGKTWVNVVPSIAESVEVIGE
ncbi:MAG TPA: DUF3048 domain-containing protein [Bacillota bacterium]|nr:DUF3048 domain-containing protein [Bacillota bacterium]